MGRCPPSLLPQQFFSFSFPATHQCRPGWSSGQGSIGYSIRRGGGQLAYLFFSFNSYIYIAHIRSYGLDIVPSTFATVEGNCHCTVFCIFINVQYGYSYHLSYFSHWKLWNLINSWFTSSINWEHLLISPH